MALYTINIKTGEVTPFYRSTDWLNHVQFSPTDPKLMMYCHEGPGTRLIGYGPYVLMKRYPADAQTHNGHGNRGS